jgi:hypothetical protein
MAYTNYSSHIQILSTFREQKQYIKTKDFSLVVRHCLLE